jgi:hypothetical protein
MSGSSVWHALGRLSFTPLTVSLLVVFTFHENCLTSLAVETERWRRVAAWDSFFLVSFWTWENLWGGKTIFGEREAGLRTLRVVTADLSREHAIVFAIVCTVRMAPLFVNCSTKCAKIFDVWEWSGWLVTRLFYIWPAFLVFVFSWVYNNTVHVNVINGLCWKQLWFVSSINAD